MKVEISIHIQVYMVPVQHDCVLWDLVDSGNHCVHYILKMSTKLEYNRSTYFFPSGRCRGLISTDLNCEKKSSQTAPSYECGPVNITGMSRCLRVARVSNEVW